MLLPVFAQAQVAHLTPEQFQKFFASDYAKEFADEFNAYKKIPISKEAYGYLYPAHARRSLLKWDERTSVKAEGSTLIVQHGDSAPVRIEIVDLFRQQYKINGKKFVHDWNADPRMEAAILQKKIQPQGVSLLELLVPKSEANPAVVAEGVVGAEIAADIAILAMREAAIDLAVKSASAEALAVTTGDAATVAGTRAGISLSAEQVEKALELIFKDPKFHEKMAHVAYQRQAEMMQKMVETLDALVKPPKPKMIWSFLKSAKALAGILENRMSQLALGLTVYSLGAKTNPMAIMQCWYYSYRMGADQCNSAVKAVQASKSAPANPAVQVTCYNQKGVDLTGYFNKSNGKKDVFSVHYGSLNAGESAPVSAIGFSLGANGRVDAGTVRQYDLKFDSAQTGDKGFFVSGVKSVVAKDSDDLTSANMMPQVNPKLENDAAVEDMVLRQKNRDAILKAATLDANKLLSRELLEEFHNNMDIIKQEDTGKQHELALIAELTLLYTALNGACNFNAKADPKTVSAASVPAGDTGVLPVDKTQTTK